MTNAVTGWAPALVAASLVLGWFVAAVEPFSTGATVAVLALGAGAMAVGGRGRTRRPRGTPLGAATPWLVAVGALVAWQLAAYVQRSRSEHPTLSSLTNAALDARPFRAVAFAAWLLAAGWLARR